MHVHKVYRQGMTPASSLMALNTGKETLARRMKQDPSQKINAKTFCK